ncbi:hypothetical protein DFA_08443 [Cavenderia fasciculata]|uniref:Uncharacterized protein n=1 Tax=Cavenderia fasciculata TaxID=261658 RepID=F4Q674_CACFS|nr:uncharacterized protein DFA_08443 [Cavenderia fasciculata]EGG17448.1 hypothetical protein DFA_08443 [Cavenderia fasciculata]|eukprot:XP_004355932.1 hypothetical protein DFA_08443 [Cavenderia fasciculata]
MRYFFSLMFGENNYLISFYLFVIHHLPMASQVVQSVTAMNALNNNNNDKHQQIKRQLSQCAYPHNQFGGKQRIRRLKSIKQYENTVANRVYQFNRLIIITNQLLLLFGHKIMLQDLFHLLYYFPSTLSSSRNFVQL